VVSNSLPTWLTLGNIVPFYPSFAVPYNLAPPYAAVHIEPSNTTALQQVPWIDNNLVSWQLTQDKVRLELYGVRNQTAIILLNAILKYMTDYETIGLMNTPIVCDEKRTQVELGVLAMKKTIEFDVSYYQSAQTLIAYQYILSAIPTYKVGPLIVT
jgi:hypothetical protein